MVALIHSVKDMGEIGGGNSFPVIGTHDFLLLLRFDYGQGHLPCVVVRQGFVAVVV